MENTGAFWGEYSEDKTSEISEIEVEENEGDMEYTEEELQEVHALLIKIILVLLFFMLPITVILTR